MSRDTARAVSDLPEPDSPTTATASPRRIENVTPRTGRIGPPAAGKLTVRSRTSRTTSDAGLLSVLSGAGGAAPTGAAGEGFAEAGRPTRASIPKPLATDSPSRLRAR